MAAATMHLTPARELCSCKQMSGHSSVVVQICEAPQECMHAAFVHMILYLNIYMPETLMSADQLNTQSGSVTA